MKSKTFVASVGALVGALVVLIGYLLDWPAEAYPLVGAVVGASLAVWRAFPAIVILLALAGGVQCSSVTVRAHRSVYWEVSRSTCRVIIDADGRRVFELIPATGVQCSVEVAP